MKHIHFVVPYQSVAMRRMSEPLIVELAKLYEVTTSEIVDETADLNYHIPWHTLVDYEGSGKHAMAYTHCNAGAEGALISACERADLITCMTFTGRQELIDFGVDPKKLWVIYPAADQYVFQKRMIGIIGYPQPNGRKRESLLIDLAWQCDMTPFQFIFIGAGWDELVTKLKSCGVFASTFHADTDDQLRAFYHQIDLLLVTGYREGGPLPILEAMASGADILSPDFGFASDLLDESQIYGTLEDLAAKLEDFVAPYVMRHKLARSYSWKDYCAEHALIFGRLLGESVDLYPESGMNRYVQLLEIIEKEKVQSIAEIGTWNGSRAIQMIQAANKHAEAVTYQGFDLFDEQTPAQVRTELSKYSWEKELVQKRIDTTRASVDLIGGNTVETMKLLNDSDFYFVDGGHSEATIHNDGCYVIGKLDLNPNSVAVFDDYYHANKPDGMGCNKFIDNLPSWYEVTHLPNQTVASDGRVIGMVKVRRTNADLSLQRWAARNGDTAFDDGESVSYMSSVSISNAPSPTGC